MERKLTLKNDQVPFVFCSIKERLAGQLLQLAHTAITITHTSSVEGYTSWDIVLESGSTKQIYVTELKIRKQFSDFSWFKTEGIILEKIKYDALTTASSTPKGIQNKVKPLFLVFLFDCVLIWDISHIKEKDFITKEYRKASVNGRYETQMKDVTYLQVKDAQRIDFQMDYDTLIKETTKKFNNIYNNKLKENEEND